ncbi:type III-B CRISPR module-associated protein Cmr5 [Pleurocapsales cyanobacterium LEGE 06147]|nr:type III-B CRISPR module-associated protein Cmr5 [Pleurocapsales cyanobacterium LEGE 06147]
MNKQAKNQLNSPQTNTNTLITANYRDLDRSRAANAWNDIQSVTKKEEKFQKKYSAIARKLPTLIQINGLAQTLTFLKAKGEPHHLDTFNHLSGWVCHRFNWNNTDLLTQVLAQDMDSQRYRLVTAEALAFLQWLKRFAEAEIAEIGMEDND